MQILTRKIPLIEACNLQPQGEAQLNPTKIKTMNTTTINKEQTLVQNISNSIRQELDVDKFLETLTVESAIEHLKQFTISGWFLLKVIGAVIFLLAVQVYKLGKQVKVYFQPTLTSLSTKVYNYCKPIDNPVTQFITGLLTKSDDLDNDAYDKTFHKSTPITDSNGNPLTIRLQTTSNQTPESVDSQKQSLTHTNN